MTERSFERAIARPSRIGAGGVLEPGSADVQGRVPWVQRAIPGRRAEGSGVRLENAVPEMRHLFSSRSARRRPSYGTESCLRRAGRALSRSRWEQAAVAARARGRRIDDDARRRTFGARHRSAARTEASARSRDGPPGSETGRFASGCSRTSPACGCASADGDGCSSAARRAFGSQGNHRRHLARRASASAAAGCRDQARGAAQRKLGSLPERRLARGGSRACGCS